MFLRAPSRWLSILVFSGLTAFAARDERWLRVTAPAFTVITPMAEKDALASAGEFSQFIAALQGFIPVDPRLLPRLTIVVFARERDFAAYRPLAPNGKPKEVAGFFSRRDSWAVAGMAATGLSAQARTTIFHEGTHWFLSAYELTNPVWLEEGLAETFSTFTVDRKNVSLGQAIVGHVETLRHTTALPLERLLFLTQSDLFTGGIEGSTRTGMAYAQSWALVHYLMFGQRDVPARALADYVRLLRTAVHPDEAFREAFGITYGEMDRKLRVYVEDGQYFIVRRPPAVVPELRIETATRAEVEDALARLCLAGGRSKEALEHAIKATEAAGDSPVPFELLGQVHKERGEGLNALAAFQQAIDKGSRDFRPYFERAMAKHLAVGNEDGSIGHLSPGEARAVANDYEQAINFNPRYRPAYQSLSGILDFVPPGNAQDNRFLRQGLALFPDDAMIRLGLAVLARRDGDRPEAQKLLEEVLTAKKPPPANVRNYARRLEANWREHDLFGRIDELAAAKNYTEALALADRQIETLTDATARSRLQATRQNLSTARQIETIKTAWEERKWPEARRLIEEFLASDAASLAKMQLRRQLAELDRLGLGKTQKQ